MNAINPQDALEMANKNVGRHLHSRTQVFPSIVIPNFGFGLLGKYEVNSETVQGTPNQFKYHYTNDWTGVLAANAKLAGGRIKVGASLRATNRAEIRRDDLDVTSTNLSLKSLAAEGIGVGADAGLLLAMPIKWLPSIGAVYRDVGNTKYNYQKGMFLNIVSVRPR